MPIPFRRPLLSGGFALLLATLPGAVFAQTTPTPAETPAAAAPAETPETVVATVDGEPITVADLMLAESELDPQFSRLPADQRRTAALSAVIEIRLVAKKAAEAGLADDAEFERRMAFLRQRALHSAYVEQQIVPSVDDAAIRARYDLEVANTPASNEVRARHILVETKEEAAAIIKQLDEGADFEAIAKEKSSDTGSGAQGGDLGYFGQGQMVPEFEQAAFALEVGQHSKEPVQSQFGFHVIKVEDKRAKQPPAYDEVKEQFRSVVLREKYIDAMKSIRGEAAIEIADPKLKAALDAMEKTE